MKRKSYLTFIITIIFVISMIPILYFGTFTRAGGDDFVYSVGTHALVQSNDWNVFSLIKMAIDISIGFYNTWQGTYSACALMPLQTGIFGAKYYYISGFILILISLFCVMFLIKTVTKYYMAECKYVWATSIGVTATLFQGMPGIGQGLYSHNSAWHYTLFSFLVFLNIALVIRFINDSSRKSIIVFTILSCLLSFFISGGTQMVGFEHILILGCILVGFYFHYGKKALLILVPLSISVFGFLLTLVAPGTIVRQNAEREISTNIVSQGVISTVISSILELYRLLSTWVNITWICFIILLTPVALMFIKTKREKLRIHPLIILPILMIILIGMICVPIYGTGKFGTFSNDRLVDVVWLAFMLFSAFIYIYSLIWIDQRFSLSFIQKLGDRWEMKILFLVAVFAIGFSAQSNAYKTFNDIRHGNAQAYVDAYDARVEQIIREKENGTVYVEPFEEYSQFLDSDDWMHPWGAFYDADVKLIGE